jgi:epsilon-lactone hydrolase
MARSGGQRNTEYGMRDCHYRQCDAVIGNPTFRNWRQRRRGSLASWMLRHALWLVRLLSGPLPKEKAVLVAVLRGRMDRVKRFLPRTPPGWVSLEVQEPGFSGHWMYPGELHSADVLLYVHGGGYIMGSPADTHRDLIVRIGTAAQAKVLAVNYAKAPESVFPAAIEQVLAAYRYLRSRYASSRIALGGDSAGGGLALGAALRLRQQGLPMPGALFTLSACADLSGSGRSVQTNARRDVVVPAHTIPIIAELYLGTTAADDPIASPVFGDYSGFPPTLMQVGSHEVFLDDSVRIATKLRAAGVPVLLDVWDRLPHVWQIYAAVLPEGQAAIEDIGRFTRSHLRDPVGPLAAGRAH